MSKILDTIKTHSTVIEGGANTLKVILQEIDAEKVDHFFLQSHADKLSMDEFRSVLPIFNLKHGSRKIVIVYVAGISDMVQNAMLKTLEEGNENVQMVVIIPNSSILLPTFVSRIHILKDLVDENFDEKFVKNILSKTLSQKLLMIKELEEHSRQDVYFLANSLLPHMIAHNKFEQVQKILEIMHIFVGGNINKKQLLQYVFTAVSVI